MSERFSVIGRIKSFRYAIAGIVFMLKSQQNAQVHLAITCVVVALGMLFGVSRDDWLWLLFAIAFVWIAETVNTAFEYLCDVVSPQLNPAVGKAKDIAAGAVLIAAVVAVIVGLAVFIPLLT